MIKKLLFLIGLALLFVAAPPIRADAADYGTNNSVGFTGKYEVPKENKEVDNSGTTQTQTANKSIPASQSKLPNTGTKTLDSSLGLLSLTIAMILTTSKFLIRGKIHE